MNETRMAMQKELTSIGVSWAAIVWPVLLTPDEFVDFEYWLTRVIHKSRRAMQDAQAQAATQEQEAPLDAPATAR